MKIFLIFPQLRRFPVIPNLGLGYLGSYLKTNGHDVKIIHCGKEKYSIDQLIDVLIEEKPDLIGLQSLTVFHNTIRLYCREIKKRMPNSIIIVGGPHPSGVKEQLLIEEQAIDFGMCGEAEIGLSKFCKMMERNESNFAEIPGLMWRESSQVHANPIQVMSNLNKIPFPLWEQINPHNYPNQPHGTFAPEFPIAPIIFSRGCIYNCTYCASKSISGKGIRFRSIDDISSEIKILHDDFMINTFAFIDQDITSNKENLKLLCSVLKKFDDIKWYCPNGIRMENIDIETAREMKSSGCYSVTVGVETASENINIKTRKHLMLKNVKDKIKILHSCGIKTTGNFMIGFPGESISQMLKTVLLSLTLHLDRAQFVFFIPLPGSEDYNKFIRKRKSQQDTDWSLFDVDQPNFVIKHRICAKIIYISAFLLFYIRPVILLNSLKEIRTFDQFKYILKRIF